MLKLTRRKKESIRINDDISIQVASICGQTVTLTISAPQKVLVSQIESISRDEAKGLPM